MINERAYKLGSKRSTIREIFEYAKKRSGEIGAENVFDFSIGNPSVPAPDVVNETIARIVNEMPSVVLHGYTSAPGDLGVRCGSENGHGSCRNTSKQPNGLHCDRCQVSQAF